MAKKQYEISNHLGNVLVTITDEKYAYAPFGTANNGFIATYFAQYKKSSDYTAFGAPLESRQALIYGEYRYGFQNQERDNEFWSGAVSFKYRVEDPRLGRFFSVDPLCFDYPFYSSYQFSGNRLIDSYELEGLEPNNMHAEDGIYGDGAVDTGEYERGDKALRLTGKEGSFDMVALRKDGHCVGWLAQRVIPVGDATAIGCDKEMKQDAFFVAIDKFGEFNRRKDEFFKISRDCDLFELLWGDISRSEIKQGILLFALESGMGKILKFGTKGNYDRTLKTGSNTNSQGLSDIGNAFDKHSARRPDIWGKSTGNNQNKNAIGATHMQDIFNAPGKFKLKVSDTDVTKVFLEKVLPDGRGLRLNRDQSFKGFID